jgi:hypothetical protein
MNGLKAFFESLLQAVTSHVQNSPFFINACTGKHLSEINLKCHLNLILKIRVILLLDLKKLLYSQSVCGLYTKQNNKSGLRPHMAIFCR